jgi:hypothetical protein
LFTFLAARIFTGLPRMCFQNHSASDDSVMPPDRMIDGRIMAGKSGGGPPQSRTLVEKSQFKLAN